MYVAIICYIKIHQGPLFSIVLNNIQLSYVIMICSRKMVKCIIIEEDNRSTSSFEGGNTQTEVMSTEIPPRAERHCNNAHADRRISNLIFKTLGEAKEYIHSDCNCFSQTI